MENLVANSTDYDQMPHYVASDLGLHCLTILFYRFPGKNGLIFYHISPYLYVMPC